MTTPDIGDQITATYRGQQITGRIVGVEDASQRRGYGTGRLLVVRVDSSGEWAEVRECDAWGANVGNVECSAT